MTSEHHLLFGVLAYQNGLVTRSQLLAAVDQWLQDKTQGIDRILLHDGAVSAEGAHLLQDLMDQLLCKQGEQESLIRSIGSDTESLLAELRKCGDEEIYATIGPAASPPTASRDRPAEVTGGAGSRFRILRPHAEGGLGKVSVALDTELDREVALKEIKPRYADDAASRSRFLLEAEITGGLEHPGIVPIYGLGARADGRPFYAMRFIKGDNLAVAVRQFHENTDQADREVGRRRLLGRFLDVCNAVYYAHQRGVLHRDLKPGNVMLGEFGETLVVDWGLAKPVDQDEQMPGSPGQSAQLRESHLQPRSGSVVDATQLGSAIGSPHYMSPEQARGENDRLGPTTDVYSLGATLYTLLTNRKPVEGETVQEILENVQCRNRLTARQVNPHVDRALSAICQRAMALDANDRFPSVRDLANDVERYLADEPVQAYREPWVRRTQRWVRKHPRSVGSLATMLVAGVLSATTVAGVVANSNRQLGDKNVKLAQLNEDLEASRKEAIEARDEAVQARDEAHEVVEFLITSFRSPDPAAGGRELTVVELLDAAILRVENFFSGAPKTQAALLDALGQTYTGLGLPHEAVRLCSMALSLRREHLDPEDQRTLLSMNHLAQAYLLAGYSERALTLNKEALKIWREMPNADPADVALATHRLAAAYEAIGDGQKALQLQEEAYELVRQQFGESDFRSALLMGNLARYNLNRAKQLELYRRSYESLSAQLGEDHPQTLSALELLAKYHGKTYNVEQAVTLYAKILDLRREKLGADHPSTLATSRELASILIRAKQDQEALALLEDAVRRARASLHADHPLTQSLVADLAVTQTVYGNRDKGMSIIQEALQQATARHGDDHPQTLQNMLLLASAYAGAEKTQQAHELYEKAYLQAREALGEFHEITVSALKYLADSHASLGNEGESLRLLETHRDHCQRERGQEHADTLTAMYALANAYFEQNRFDSAAELLERVVLLSRSGGEAPVDNATLIFKLAQCRQCQGNHAAACSLLEQHYRINSELFGEESLPTGQASLRYRDALLLAERYSDAIDFCSSRLDASRAAGEGYLVHNYAAIAEAQLALGQLDEAAETTEESQASAKTLDPNDGVFYWTNSILGSIYARQQKWSDADKYLQLAELVLPSDEARSIFSAFDWHRADRIYRDLAYVHDQWDDSTEREKWHAELSKFESQRAVLDPLMRAERLK